MRTNGMIVWTLCLGITVVGLAGCPQDEQPLEVIFDQGSFGMGADASVLTTTPPPRGTQAADMFTLAAGLTTISRIEWWGSQDPGVTVADEFVIRIFRNTGGLPEAIPLYAIPVGSVSRTNTGRVTLDSLGGTPVYRYFVDLSPFDLDAQYGYFISILNQAGHEWLWMYTYDATASTVTCSRISDGGIWNPSYDHDLAFRLWRHTG